MLSGIMLFGQTALFIGLSENLVLAEESSMVDNDQGQGFLAGLRRIEDGSVISNSHTSKWRIFTDNGRELFLKGKLDEAEKYFSAALEEAKEGFGTRDPHVASSCNNLAELYRVRKAFEKAEPLYLEAISILEESFGADDIRVGAALHNLGQFYLAQRKLDQAHACYERALKIKGRVLGYGHTDYANTMYHLGTVLHLQGKEKDSVALVQESIRILEESGQGQTTTCIRRMRYLSQMLLKSNRLVEAENLQRKILHILEISKGWDSMDTVVAAEDLALILQSLGSLQDAQELFEQCLDVRKTILAEDHVQIAANMLHLARIALLKSTQLRRLKIADARDEVERAKVLLDDSIRIAKTALNHSRKKQSVQSDSTQKNSKDEHVALIILLQSLDTIGLWEAAKHELGEKEDHIFPLEAELALRECFSIIKEPVFKRMLQSSPDAKVAYLSCLKHLVNLLTENAGSSLDMLKLKDEARQIEAELLHSKRHSN
ncbi:putative tetratricopeptide-like helical domain superfamily [Dioscorea sansibarensis]